MKTTFKLLGGLILILSLGSCEKEELDIHDPSLENLVDLKAGSNFNNGMIHTYSNEVVLLWNELLSQSIGNSMPQPAEAKIYAMVTLSMHDALNNVVPKYETYALDNLAVDAGDISKKNIHSIADAAVSQAARDMLVQLFPPATTAADELLNSILSGIQDSGLKTRGILIGENAAAAVIAKRANDFPMGFQTYTGGGAPGEYQSNYLPMPIVFAPNLGELTPFGILSGSQFRNESPHPLNSADYIADYNEVKSLGCTDCPARTAEQTQIGAFWIESNASSMNRIARTLIQQRKLDGWEAARLIGLVEMAVMDAYIASFEGKAYFQFWRPVTAIRLGDVDGVDATAGDATWTSSFTTPPTPEFPSTHAYNGGAAAAVFRSYFKTDQVKLIATSPYYLPGVERQVASFSQMAHENAVSRIYIGFHFRYAVEVGEKQGKELGEYVFNNNSRELKKIK